MFFKLPKEIQKEIFNHLGLNGLIDASRVCKQWNTYSNDRLTYQKSVLGYRFLQINDNVKFAEKFSLKEAVYGIESAEYRSTQSLFNAIPAYCKHMKDKIPRNDFNKTVSWALGKDSSLIEKQIFLNLIRHTPEWLRYLSVNDAAELCIQSGNQQLAAMKTAYKIATGNDIDQYIKDNIPDVDQRIVQALVNHALGECRPSFVHTALNVVIETPQYVKYLPVKDAAELCIKAGDHLLARLKSLYKKQTGNDIDQYMNDHIPNAKARIVKVLVKKTLAKNSSSVSIFNEIVFKPELVSHLSVEDAAALCISSGNKSDISALKLMYKKATGLDIDAEIERIVRQDAQPSFSLSSGI
ncbi:F-box protein [Legionella waltersii]|uniref:F-box-like protein n=1 Tax=Legionella waltersii TaxID=66969 RepID=A0A0W1A1Q0_9GAMM|nr:F-box protein [Legionella waltersii]KTD75294.1 F-box-like protein [Legionella waltersii]SNV06977.1 F-box-like [Legionella waltersii]